MHMNVAAVVMPVRVGAYQRLVSGEMLFTKLFAQLLRPVYGQAVVGCVTGVKTDETFFDFLSWYAAVMDGGYLVIIPRKQTCSPYLKRSLCRWVCDCPALFFPQIVDYICHA